MERQLMKLCIHARERPVEFCLQEVLGAEVDSKSKGLLPKLLEIEKVFQEFEYDCSPDLGYGDLATVRVLRPRSGAAEADVIQSLISCGENSQCEFKSSLSFDWDRYEKKKYDNLRDLDSELVLQSFLKTVAAFINAEGGTLLVGVKDDGEIRGIENDFQFCGEKKGNIDGWELRLRAFLGSRFYPPKIVEKYVVCNFATFEGLTVARILVGQMRGPIFLKNKEGQFELYLRSGNRTLKVEFQEIATFFDLRRRD